MSVMDIQLNNVSKAYRKAGEEIVILERCTLSIEAGEHISIVGPSGCGKSTFMHLIGMLDRPTSGEILFAGQNIATMRAKRRDELRNRKVGFVFQSHHLLTEHTALDNVTIPVRLAGAPVAVARARARALLEAVGLGKRLEHRPGELSGGEQQRVAIARAMVMGPSLILADEPTGNLDPRTSDGVFEQMRDMAIQLGSTLIVVTHSHELASRFPRQLRLDLGRFEELGS